MELLFGQNYRLGILTDLASFHRVFPRWNNEITVEASGLDSQGARFKLFAQNCTKAGSLATDISYVHRYPRMRHSVGRILPRERQVINQPGTCQACQGSEGVREPYAPVVVWYAKFSTLKNRHCGVRKHQINKAQCAFNWSCSQSWNRFSHRTTSLPGTERRNNQPCYFVCTSTLHMCMYMYCTSTYISYIGRHFLLGSLPIVRTR